jgi:hypothetical protein
MRNTSAAGRRGRSLLAALLLIACASSAPAEPEIPGNALRVLFIGNSLTYFNDLPSVVAAMAIATGQERPPAFAMAAQPDYSLEDHWNDGRARQAIASGPWHFVVMQQGPSSLVENRELLREWAQRFAGPIRESGARPALYMVWPSSARSGDFDGVLAAYSGAATAVDGLFMPAGEAWRAAWRRDAEIPLYGPDGFHPSALGTYLAALVIFARLYDVSPDVVPSTLPVGTATLRVADEVAAHLREAVKEVLATYPAN